MRKRIKRLLFPLLRGAVGMLALVGYLTAALGVPMPAPRAPSSCQSPAAPAEGRSCCCTGSEGCCCCCGGAPAEQSEDVAVVWVIGAKVRQCHGQDSLWLTVGVALPLPPAVAARSDESPAAWIFPAQALFTSLTFAPPAPPPRA
jgi:hypothetical protein